VLVAAAKDGIHPEKVQTHQRRVISGQTLKSGIA